MSAKSCASSPDPVGSHFNNSSYITYAAHIYNSGSTHFINKCDNGIVIHRNRDESMGPLDQVKVLVRKVRNKAAGTIGEATLRYNRVTGDYEDVREA